MKIRILSFIFSLLFLGLIARLFYWQVVKGQDLSREAKGQYDSSQITTAPRGNIEAGDGSFWAIRMDSWVVFANAALIKDSPRHIAEILFPFFVKDASRVDLAAEADRLEGLLKKKGSYIPLEKRVDTDTKNNIQALKIGGLGFENQEVRFYPEASSAAQLLGFVGKDESGADVGYFGLEGYYNLPLSGKQGFLSGEKSANGAPILLDRTQDVSAINGVNLVTSVDKRVQFIAEEHLKDGIEKYGASGGSITIADPKSGDILAMASYPSFDPSHYWDYNDSLFKNPVISDSFEPGSIFKILVMAAGIDAGVVKPDTSCDICGSPLKLDKYFIKTWNNQYHPDISMTDVIVNSDNVGMAFVGQKLGADKLFDYLDKFGIGHATGVDLQGEAAPSLRKRGSWNVVDLATASFGQGIAVTGIQMVRAVSAIANGGLLVRPRVVTAVAGDGWKEDVNGGGSERVISRRAAGEITQMMVEAANKGEAKWARIPGYKVAGKTGTAQIALEGHYDPINTNHSFIGFAPANNPRFVMLVTLKSPTSSPWAAETAAPLWYSIARDLFPYLGISPSE